MSKVQLWISYPSVCVVSKTQNYTTKSGVVETKISVQVPVVFMLPRTSAYTGTWRSYSYGMYGKSHTLQNTEYVFHQVFGALLALVSRLLLFVCTHVYPAYMYFICRVSLSGHRYDWMMYLGVAGRAAYLIWRVVSLMSCCQIFSIRFRWRKWIWPIRRRESLTDINNSSPSTNR